MALPYWAIKKYFRNLQNPRVLGCSTHLLLDIDLFRRPWPCVKVRVHAQKNIAANKHALGACHVGHDWLPAYHRSLLLQNNG